MGPGGALKREFETEKGDVGLDEYETRSWAGWHHHIAMCLLGGAFLLSLQQDWGGKDAPDHEATGVPGGAGDAAPGAVRARSIAVVAGGYAATQRTGLAVPTRDAAPPAAKAGWSRHLKPVVVVLEVWPESHWPGFALRQADVFQSYTAWSCMLYVSRAHCYIDNRR